MPLFSSYLTQNIIKSQSYINNNIFDKLKCQKNDLVLLSIHGIYGYRTGIFGFISNFLSNKLSKFSKPTILSRCVNSIFSQELVNNDYEIFSLFFTMVSRKIPILNMGNGDLKRKIFHNKFLKYNINHSLPNIFNLSSIYMLNPLFDSGMGIYSNREPLFSGFERWNISSTLGRMKYTIYNKGISWYFYGSDNKENAICVFNISLVDDVPDWIISSQLKQIVKLKNNLMEKYNSEYEKYENIIIGDFKIEFNLRDIINEIELKWKILEDANLKIIGKGGISSTDFILYEEKNSKCKLNIIKNEYLKNENDTLFSIEIDNNMIENNKEMKKNMSEPNIDILVNIEKNIENCCKDEDNKEVYEEIYLKEITIVEEKDEDKQKVYEKIDFEDRTEECDLKEIITVEEKEEYKSSLLEFKIDIEKSKNFENILFENNNFRDLNEIVLKDLINKNIDIKDNYFSENVINNKIVISDSEISSDEEWQKI